MKTLTYYILICIENEIYYMVKETEKILNFIFVSCLKSRTKPVQTEVKEQVVSHQKFKKNL